MRLSRFEVNNFRNMSCVQLDLGSSFNIFYGNNGSGKTSFLEAIYYLGLGRSFRSQSLCHIITHRCNFFSIFARIHDENGSIIPVGIERAYNGLTRIRIVEKDIYSHAQLAKLLPLQLINTDAYRLLEAGPRYRRQFMDWGMFHVEHSFLLYWRKMQRALKQRNAELKRKEYANKNQMELWNKEFETASIVLHNLRKEYIEKLSPILSELLETLLGEINITIKYYPGWDAERSLSELLSENLTHDIRFGYTGIGPHRADLRFKINSTLAKEILSRGQQKLFVCGLQLAQGLLLHRLTSKRCIYLIDDLPSELDSNRCQQVVKVLTNMHAQTFITGIERSRMGSLLNNNDMKLFHVKHGEISPIL